jgi:hypothetical protein
MTVKKVFGAIITLCILACPAWAQPASFGISFIGTAVQVSGAPPGHDVLVLSIAHEAGRYVRTVVRREKTLSGAPGNKIVPWDIGRKIPLRSVWCAIDLQTSGV